MAAVACFIGAVFSWLRGAGQSEVFHSMSDDVEVGLSGAGEIAMSDVGAGSTGATSSPTTTRTVSHKRKLTSPSLRNTTSGLIRCQHSFFPEQS
jgi:hypothetical protein